MYWGSDWGLQWGLLDIFTVSTVDVRIINGMYVPCRTCHWRNQCVVPKGKMLPKFKEYYGNSDIIYHDNFSQLKATNIVYRCYEYTTINTDAPRGATNNIANPQIQKGY